MDAKRITSRDKRLGGLVALTVSALTLVSVCFGQQPAGPGSPGALEEVIVTAQKREANLQDVPFSVDSVSGINR